MGQMASLREIDLCQNRIETVPESICALPHLARMVLNNNPLAMPMAEYLADFFRDNGMRPPTPA
jgi:hypothetical protein